MGFPRGFHEPLSSLWSYCLLAPHGLFWHCRALVSPWSPQVCLFLQDTPPRKVTNFRRCNSLPSQTNIVFVEIPWLPLAPPDSSPRWHLPSAPLQVGQHQGHKSKTSCCLLGHMPPRREVLVQPSVPNRSPWDSEIVSLKLLRTPKQQKSF